ncbi:hypothetical protein [Nocardia sp. NBC_01327]|uniref:hypothetical protein n=1 Tax=Nocardia sp. NBC_01327 TaxID=2903593 RepID=UPI002E10392F|nr:hypothetical protein OG326_17120 [Nocardia sp. NBC_01327]
MTGTPPSAPNAPSGDNPGEEGGGQYTARPGAHQNPEPPPHSGAPEQGPGHGRHELPGLAGYPQFSGPGAAQYGSEAVEPPPPLPPQSGAPGSQSGYAPSGGIPQQGGYTPQPGGYAPQQGSPQQGAYAPGQGGPQQGGYAPQGGPQQGGYAPQQGGYAPQQGAQQGDYGQPPSGYGQAPGAVPPGGQQPSEPQSSNYEHPPISLNVGRAISYGWDRFRANPVPWIGMVLVGLIAWLVVTLLVNIVDVQSLTGVLLLFIVAALVMWLLQAAMIRGALYETDGTPPDFSGFFGFVNAGSVLITALIVFVACLIASMLCVFPVVIVGVLCMFALHFVIDQEMDPLTAIKSSAQLVISNALQVILLALAVLVITFVGALLCGLGLLVAGPVTAIAITYAYRTLTGRLVVQY